MEFFLLSIFLVALAFIAIGVNVFFRKGGKFPDTEVGLNRNIKELGITCPRCDEIQTWHQMNIRKKLKIRPDELTIDPDDLK